MIGSALQRAIVRTMLGLMAERGLQRIEEANLIAILLEAGIAINPQECHNALSTLKSADIIQNGHGTKLNLSGTGMALGTTIALPPAISISLRKSIDLIFSSKDNDAQDTSTVSVEV